MTDMDNKPSQHRTLVLSAITVAFLLAGLAYGVYYWLVLSKREQTDNAYVGGNLVTLSAQVSGNVQAINADETQRVMEGAVVVTLDSADADLALRQAEAHLAAVVRQQRERYSNLDQYEAEVKLRKLDWEDAKDELARRRPLAADHTLSGEEIAQAEHMVRNTASALDVAVKRAAAAQAGLVGVEINQNPSVLAAKADYIQAWLALRRNQIHAPVTGYVAKRGVQLGSRVAPGTPLLSIVPLDQLWIDANFKESELQNIRVGQPAIIEADMYGSQVEYHGRVVGLAAGTGSAFSLLPAQNATGNWIKVVQRVPVRISLDPKELVDHPLRVGLSTVVTIDTHDTSGTNLGAAMTTAPVYTTHALTQSIDEAEQASDAIIARNLSQ